MNMKRLSIPFALTIAFLTVAGLLILVGAMSQGTLVHASPSVLYVAPGGDCGGASPCYSTVQDAVDAAQPGDEIRVAAGLYTGINNKGGLAQMVYIDKSVTIRGGYTTSDWDNPNPDANHTELNAQTLGRVVYITGTDTVVTLEGLHLTYGNSNGLGGYEWVYPYDCSDDVGGGVYIFKSSVTISHCWIDHSASPSDDCGGGLYVYGGILQMTRTRMEDNEAGYGGAMYLHYTQTEVGDSSVFRDNRLTEAIGDGAAIKVSYGVLTCTNSIIESNEGGNVQSTSGALHAAYGLSLIHI